MNIAYIRVSSKDQNPGRQLEKIKALGIDERFVFIDKASGRNFVRPEYIAMKRMLREGDLLYIDSLDRLGRNYDGVISEWKEITRKINADIIVLDRENLFDSRKFKSMGNIGKLMEDQFLSLLSYLADEERNKIRARQREGIDLALSEKRPYGRPGLPISDTFIAIYNRWKSGEITAIQAMKESGCKKTTWYKLIKKHETAKNREKPNDPE